MSRRTVRQSLIEEAKPARAAAMSTITNAKLEHRVRREPPEWAVARSSKANTVAIKRSAHAPATARNRRLRLAPEEQKNDAEQQRADFLDAECGDVGERGWMDPSVQSPSMAWRRTARALPVASSTSTITACNSGDRREASMRTGRAVRKRG